MEEMAVVYYCVRVYANLSAKHTYRDEEGLKSWLEYNRSSRPGNALFVDGIMPEETDSGYLKPDMIEKLSAEIQKEMGSGIHNEAKAAVMGDQYEFFGGLAMKRFGYPDESDREPFYHLRPK